VLGVAAQAEPRGHDHRPVGDVADGLVRRGYDLVHGGDLLRSGGKVKRMPTPRLVTPPTDFGTRDGYVGAMKGVIFARAPGVRVVDVTHDVAPQDIAAAAFALAQAAPHFPDGTIHVVVVDPGVGGRRRGVVVDGGQHLYVGPDNGVFS